MPPAKAARGGQDDSKADNPITKEKNGSGTGSNGKMRRVASSAGTNLREVASTNATNAAAAAAAAAAANSAAGANDANTPGVKSPFFQVFSVFSSVHNAWTDVFCSPTAAMARIREGRPPRLPASIPPQDADRLRQRPPPMGAHPGGEHRPLLTDDRKKEGFSKANERPIDQRGAEALQRLGRAGE